MPEKLTAVSIRNLKPGPKKYEVMDADNPGFGVWVYPSGLTKFIYAYRCNHRKGRITLTASTLSAAREEYRQLRPLVREGIDPQQKKAADRAAREQDLTFGRLAERYLAEYAPNKRSGDEDARLLNYDVLPRWKNRKAKEISRRDVQEMLKSIIDRGAATTANRTLAVTRKVFNWGIEQDLIETSPCTGVKPPSKEIRSDRVLSNTEIYAFWNDLDLSPPMYTALKLQLLLGQRIGEVLGMRWDELDFDQNLWTLAGDRTKNGAVHIVPLTDQAVSLIEDMRILSEPTPFVFASPRRTTSKAPHPSQEREPIRTDSAATALLRAADRAGIARFSSHDLRRTAATNISALGYGEDLIAQILNHKNRSVTARYNRHSYLSEKREALEAWASRLDELTA
jgi:integrase